MAKKNRKNCPGLRSTLVILVLILFLALPAGAGINFNYTSTTHRNYTITDEVFNSLPPNFIRFVDGNIELPTLRLEFALNKTIDSGNRTLVLSGHFGPGTTTLPNQKVFYTVPGGTALVSYSVDASSLYFANKKVNVSTFKQGSSNVPFFSDLSFAVLNFNDLKNTWNNDTKVLDEFISALDDTNNISETSVTLDPSGNYGPITQNLGPGNYLVMVTRGDDPREIITFNNIQVLPFNSSINIGDGSGNAPQGMDLQVSISLPPSAPIENYTYITSIINRSDYANNLGDINITWGSDQTLAQATSVNGVVLDNASALIDIIPYSSTAKITTDSKSANLALNTGALLAGRYLVHTVVFNGTNLSVAFDQSLVTLASAITTPVTALNDTGYANATLNIPTPDVNIIVTIPNGTRATLSDGATLSNITTYSVASFNSTLETAASGSNLRFLGRNLTLLPEGAKFTPYILVRFNYSNADVPAGVSSLKAYWYNSSRNSWEELVTNSAGTNADGSKYIEARVPHFSTFALLGSVTTIVPSGGSGGTGAGGSGVITDEPSDNIAKAERYDKALIAGEPVIYTFTDPEHGVYEVAVTGKANEDDITLRIEALKGTSKLVAVPASGVVYKNLNILIGTKNIKEAFVRFRVENSWLNSKNLADGDIKLLKWDGSKWMQLDTAELRKDASYTYFEARTETFSHFAMSGIKTEAVATVTPAITQPGISPTVTGTSAVTGVPAGKGLQVNLVLIAVVIALIAIVVVLYIKRK